MQPFDLQLEPHEGNCDLCFLKSVNKKKTIIRARPDLTKWWIEQEASVRPDKPSGARFTTEYSYADLAIEASRQGDMFADPLDLDEFDAECGLWCGGGGLVEIEQST